MAIARSAEMIRAAYFMAKFGELGAKDSSPPAEMEAASWDEAYKRFFPRLGNGRSYETFRGSINQDRRHYIDCLAGRKTDTESRRTTLGNCPRLSRAELWALVLKDFEPVVSDSLALSPSAMPAEFPPVSPITAPSLSFSLPDEVLPVTGLVEGAIRQVTVNAFERDMEARRRCIEAHGTSCAACDMSFAAEYGPVAEGYIHVHHLRPLSEVREAHQVDPVADLQPVCPNCHAVIHRRVPPYRIDEVRVLRQQRHASLLTSSADS